MITCYIGIGSNLGDRRGYIDSAMESLAKTDGIKVKRMSSIYETDPVGGIKQEAFLNGVIEIETGLGPDELLAALNTIEKDLGRIRTVRGGPRTIDMDILYYGDEIIEEGGLVIPHPRIREREFVLKGLREMGKAIR